MGGVMMRNSPFILITAMLLSPLISHAEEVRNPFMGQQAVIQQRAAEVAPAPEQEVYRPPLQRDPLQQYQLLGVMVGNGNGRALLQTRIGEQHMIRKGDRLGLEQGVVHVIDGHGITVELNGVHHRIAVGSIISLSGGA